MSRDKIIVPWNEVTLHYQKMCYKSSEKLQENLVI